MKKAIIFDLDGTLWDSSEQVAQAWNEVLSRYPELGLTVTAKDLHGFMGKTLPDIGRLMLPDLPDDKRDAIMNECCGYENEYLSKTGGVLFPELRETLSGLKEKYSLIIVSNCQDGYIECFLDYYGLWELFEDFECPGRTGKGKGDNIRIVMERRGIEKAVYLGDTQGDLDSADYAGIPFILAEYGFGSVDRETEKIGSFKELPEAVKRVLGE